MTPDADKTGRLGRKGGRRPLYLGLKSYDLFGDLFDMEGMTRAEASFAPGEGSVPSAGRRGDAQVSIKSAPQSAPSFPLVASPQVARRALKALMIEER